MPGRMISSTSRSKCSNGSPCWGAAAGSRERTCPGSTCDRTGYFSTSSRYRAIQSTTAWPWRRNSCGVIGLGLRVYAKGCQPPAVQALMSWSRRLACMEQRCRRAACSTTLEILSPAVQRHGFQHEGGPGRNPPVAGHLEDLRQVHLPAFLHVPGGDALDHEAVPARRFHRLVPEIHADAVCLDCRLVVVKDLDHLVGPSLAMVEPAIQPQ